MKNRKTKSSFGLVLIVLIAVYGLFLRVDRFAARQWNGDEIFELHLFAEGPFKPFWQNKSLVTSGDHTSFPGEYLVTYPVMKLFGDNRWGLVIPRIAFSILGFYFLYLLCLRRFKTFLGPAIAFLFYGLNNELIYHAVELRPYSILPTLALGAFYFSEWIVCDYDQLKAWEKVVIGLFFIIGINFHAFGPIVFLLPLLYVLLEQNSLKMMKIVRADYFKFLVPVCVIGLSIWAWYAAPDRWGAHAEMKNNSFGDPFRFWPSPFVAPLAFIKTLIGNLVGYCKPLYFLLVSMVALVIPHQDRFRQWFFLFLLVLLPIALILLSDLSTGYWFVQRQFVWVMPFFAFFMGWQWDSLFHLWGKQK